MNRAATRPRSADIATAVGLGTWTTLGAIAVLCTVCALPGADHLSLVAYFALLVPALVGTGGMALLPRSALADRHVRWALYTWSVAGIGFISVLVYLTGGSRSHLYLLYALTSTFVTCCYRRRGQLVLHGLTVAAYLAVLAALGWHVGASTLLVRVVILGLVTFMATRIATDKEKLAQVALRRAALLAKVAATAREVNVLDADRVCEAVVEVVCELGMQAGHISLFNEAAGTYHMISSQGIPAEYAEAHPPVTAGIVGMVRQARATVALDQESARQYVVPVVAESNLSAVMGSPLWVDGELVGVLAGATREKRQFGPEDVEAFELLAGVASRALEGARRYQQMAESEAHTRHQASHDDLTGLPNRRLLHGVLGEALSRPGGPSERLVALLLVDLDDFKVINDTLGHHCGDQLLVTVASRLVSCVRETDMVARLSGDDFAILAQGLDRDGLDRLARRVLEKVNEPIVVGGRSLSVATSIGIAMEPEAEWAGEAPDAAAAKLLSNADMAMYEAKRAGKACHVLFDQAMSDRMNKRVAIEANLPRAIENGEMKVYYQPIFDLETSNVTGCEALLRWSHPVLGSVPPLDFIPVAEESGAIIAIGEWVVRQACAELRALHGEDERWAPLTMSVNLSPRQLRDPCLVDKVVRILEESGVPPWQLTLEITESSLLQDTEASRAKLSALATRGIQIALDDFGTGYSSLAYLQQFHVHSLKIDKCFVDGVDGPAEDRTARALVRSVAELSSALELSTVAEGVETPQQVAVLRRLGCRLGQGYVFSAAVPPEQLRALLRDHSPALRTPALDALPFTDEQGTEAGPLERAN